MEGGGSGQPLQLKLVCLPGLQFQDGAGAPTILRAVQSVSRIGRGGEDRIPCRRE